MQMLSLKILLNPPIRMATASATIKKMPKAGIRIMQIQTVMGLRMALSLSLVPIPEMQTQTMMVSTMVLSLMKVQIRIMQILMVTVQRMGRKSQKVQIQMIRALEEQILSYPMLAFGHYTIRLLPLIPVV
jgi:hypothetical protein